MTKATGPGGDDVTDLTLNDDYLAILRAVLDDPADDLPRLVLADYLEDHADKPHHVAYAEFIRLQCEIAALGDGTRTQASLANDREQDRAELRERELFADNGHLWSRPYRTKAVVRADLLRSGCCDWQVNGLSRRCLESAPQFAWSRGFVSAVSLTQAQFIGESCLLCDGVWIPAGSRPSVCPQCRGTDRTPGLTAALFRTQPITTVTLSDCTPGRLRVDESSHRTGWFCGYSTSSYSEDLPRFLAPLLWAHPLRLADFGPSANPNSPDIGWHWFATEADARAALSWACVCYGRSLAELP